MYTETTLITLAACSSFALAGIVTQDIIVDFDDQLGGLPPIQTNGLFNDHVTFSTNDDNILMIFEGAGFVGGSSPNLLTAGVSTTTDNFNGDIYMDFTAAANNVSLDIASDNDLGNIALLSIAHAGGTDVIDVVGNGNFTDVIAMDLTQYMDVTRIELYRITDEFGLGIDNLAFTAPIPAPSSMALIGISALVAGRRRR